MLVLGQAHGAAQVTLGFLAVFLATLNVVGGFVVTDRMLEMFKSKPDERSRRAAAGAPPSPRTRRQATDSMSRATATDLVYLIAIVGFIFALKGLSSPKHARRGNQLGALGMLLAVAWTFSLPAVYGNTRNLVLIVVAVAIGRPLAFPPHGS